MQGARGLTLVEVLVGAFLLQLILLAVVGLFVQAIRYNAASADISTAAALAVERMERLRGEDYDTLAAGGSLTADVIVGSTDYFDTSRPDYIVRWQITDGAVPEGGKRVAVRALALRQVSGRPKDVVLTSIRAGS